jgi:pantoate--beta-alanine ligase
MKIFETISDLRTYLAEKKKEGLSIGFVPTMGALHEGHLSLLKEAKNDSDFVVCSIFVNPIQFNNSRDLEKYPRETKSDIEKLESVNCDVLFHPSVEEMYPQPDETKYDFGQLDKVMEGEHRPGHFNGVAIVVKKLFEIVEPDKAFFGLKDYQQLVIIHKLTKDYNLPVEIIPCPTMREPNGLAMSSRNELLSPAERDQASVIYDVLKMVKIQAGFAPVSNLKSDIYRQFKKNKLIELEYFDIVDMYSLVPIKAWASSNNVIACIAVKIGNVRLIDNLILFS